MSNVGIASLTFWTPNVNIFRDPRWGASLACISHQRAAYLFARSLCGLCAAGRGQEIPGEDPVLNSDYAEGFVSGFQTGEDPNHLKASCCCKHYAGYSLESWSPNGPDDPHPTSRHDFNAIISKQDLTDTYFPPFMSCANRGNASGVMCSYSKPIRVAQATGFRSVFSRQFVLADAVNGVPSCASQGLLNINLREKWGFNGYVTSDCGAVGNVEGRSAHHFTTTDDATCAVTLGAGMDNDCGGFFGGKGGALDSAIKNGAVTKSVRESSLGNLIRVQMRLGMFDSDDDQIYRTYMTDRVDTPEHRSLALEAARQGMTLVKNNGALPLSKTKVKTVAAVGPHCNATVALQSNYHGSAPYLISPAEGLAKYASVATELGCVIGQCKGCHPKNANKGDPSPAVPPSIAKAMALAGSADGTPSLVSDLVCGLIQLTDSFCCVAP